MSKLNENRERDLDKEIASEKNGELSLERLPCSTGVIY
jgi:hypothetical protein